MFKKKKAYLITFLFSNIISMGFMMYFYFNNIGNLVDDILPVVVDPLADAVLLDSTLVAKEIPEPIVQYGNYINLKESIKDAFSQDMQKLDETKIDSTKSFLTGKVDSLSGNHQEFVQKINELHRKNMTKQDSISQMSEEINSLNSKITSLKQENIEKQEPKDTDADYKKNIRYLANTYNMMNERKVAKLMNSVSDEDVIMIFKKMNQRKVGKVLGVMPQKRANSIISKLTQRG